VNPFRDLIGLFFPRCCSICGELLVGGERHICSRCLLHLPEAYNAIGEENYVEQRLMGRIPIVAATALLLFRRGNEVQTLLHQIKYRGNEPLAVAMGRHLGLRLAESGRFDDVDLLVPVPLHPRKERKRGYNQSLLLCQGIAQTFPHPIEQGNLIRTHHTPSQTRKNRQQRLKNMEDVFAISHPDRLKGKHLLLIDDVLTTGATTEACAKQLLTVEGVSISVASLAAAGDV
jgi:ComF family protein